MRNRRTGWVYLAPILVATACLVTQLTVLFEQRFGDPTFYAPIVDAGDYQAAALRFTAGGRLIDDAFWQPPMFPFLLGCLYYVFGESILLAKLLMACAGAGSGLLVWWIGCRVFSPRVGLVAGLMLSAYGPFLFFNTQLLPAGLAVFLNLVALALWLRCVDQPGWHRWLLFGLAVGAATTTVPNSGVMLVIAIFALTVTMIRRKTWRRSLVACLLAVAGTAIPVGLVTIRNYVVSREFVAISTNGGINFYIGNNPESDRTVAIRPGAEWMRLARQSYGDTMPTRAEQSIYFLRRGLAYAIDKPFDFAAGLGEKALRVVNAREIPRNVDPYVYRDFSWLLAILMWKAGPFAFPFGLLAPLGVLGVVVSLRTSSQEQPQRIGRFGLLAYVTLYTASIIIFFVSGRYRLPVAVALLLFAAAGLDWMWRQHRRKNRPPGKENDPTNHQQTSRAAVVAFLAAAVLVNLPIRVPTDTVNFRAELLTAVGHTYAQRGELGRAEDYLRHALRLDPLNAQAVCRLATVLGQRGAFGEAERLLHTVIDVDQGPAEIHEVLAALMHHQDRLPEAEAAYRDALVVDPTSPKAHAGLAEVLAETGNVEEAVYHYREACRFTSESGEILIHLANLLIQLGDYAEAIEYYRQALWKIEPDPATLNSIAWLLATCPVVELRDCDRAIELAEHLCYLTEYRQPVALDTLAAAYAECGRLSEAVAWVQRAIEIAQSQGDHAAAASFRQRQHIYEERLRIRHERESPSSTQP